jgi:hypothetical protein
VHKETTAARKADSDRPAARSAAPAVKGGPSGRTGRPATLHNMRASDGNPVRESGPRSQEVLESQGITVWDVEEFGESGPSGHKPVKRNTGERVAPKKSGAPTLRVRR